jgi:hypothetical protein
LAYAKLSALETLGLANNKLTGELTVLNSLQKLKAVYMRNNRFSGPMASIPPTAAVVDLDNNEFTSLPKDVCTTSPRAYSRAGGCKQDWPQQGFNTCCMSGIPFDCDKPPACLALCEVACKPKPTYKCSANQCVLASGGVSKSICDANCGSDEYKCESGQCVKQAGGVSKTTCESFCG